jgi:hypothetical protein
MAKNVHMCMPKNRPPPNFENAKCIFADFSMTANDFFEKSNSILEGRLFAKK